MKLAVNSRVDPGDLGVNLRFKGKQVIHPRARAAQDALVEDVKKAIEKTDGFTPCAGDCCLYLWLTFTSNRFDVDGPVKRIMDAVERGIKPKGFTWNDLRVSRLRVVKEKGPTPGMTIHLV